MSIQPRGGRQPAPPWMMKSKTEREAANKRKETGQLCFCLGFFLSVIGVVIAAIVDKEEGVRQSVKGLLVSALVYIVCWIVYAVVTA